METDNPAVAKLTHIPPKLLEEVAGNPTKFEPVARVMAALHMDDLYRRMQHPDTPLPMRIEFQKLVNKMGRMEARDDGVAVGGGFSVTINIPAVGSSLGTVIEAKADVLDVSEDEGYSE